MSQEWLRENVPLGLSAALQAQLKSVETHESLKAGEMITLSYSQLRQLVVFWENTGVDEDSRFGAGGPRGPSYGGGYQGGGRDHSRD